MELENLFLEYQQSVIDLANKLPQWNSKDYNRRLNSAIASLFEEAGEISGLISKTRIRKDYWKKDVKTLSDYEDIRQKFIDETSDFLWVLVCSCYSLGWKGDIYNILIKEPNNILGMTFESSLYNIFDDIFSLNVCCGDIKPFIYDIIFDFNIFLSKLNEEYEIKLEDLITFNMNKLNNRYDKDGKRVDGK